MATETARTGLALADEIERLLKLADEVAWDAERSIRDDEPKGRGHNCIATMRSAAAAIRALQPTAAAKPQSEGER